MSDDQQLAVLQELVEAVQAVVVKLDRVLVLLDTDTHHPGNAKSPR